MVNSHLATKLPHHVLPHIMFSLASSSPKFSQSLREVLSLCSNSTFSWTSPVSHDEKIKEWMLVPIPATMFVTLQLLKDELQKKGVMLVISFLYPTFITE